MSISDTEQSASEALICLDSLDSLRCKSTSLFARDDSSGIVARCIFLVSIVNNGVLEEIASFCDDVTVFCKEIALEDIIVLSNDGLPLKDDVRCVN